MEKEAPSDKDNMKAAIEAYAVARGTGNPILVRAAIMLVDQYLMKLPDNFPTLEQPNPAENTDETPPAQP
jgi:hypothetical protein